MRTQGSVNTPCGDEGEENQEEHQKEDGQLMTQKVDINGRREEKVKAGEKMRTRLLFAGILLLLLLLLYSCYCDCYYY